MGYLAGMLEAASLPVACPWFSLGTLASSTTKSGLLDIAEILLKVALSTMNKIKSNPLVFSYM
jgi:hypothetical protein